MLVRCGIQHYGADPHTMADLIRLFVKPVPVTRMRQAATVCALALLCGSGRAAAPEPWPVAGQQGLVQLVIVPASMARERGAYAQQVPLLCSPERTCFLNFYTNSTDAVLAVPLPDAIDREATATYRRSAKQGAERFMWSCRMQVTAEPCF